MISPLDILYIVLAFAVLWITAALFWLVWQIATIARTVNATLNEAREKIAKIEDALNAMRARFEKATSTGTVLVEGVKRVVDYAIDRKKAHAKPDVWEDPNEEA